MAKRRRSGLTPFPKTSPIVTKAAAGIMALGVLVACGSDDTEDPPQNGPGGSIAPQPGPGGFGGMAGAGGTASGTSMGGAGGEGGEGGAGMGGNIAPQPGPGPGGGGAGGAGGAG